MTNATLTGSKTGKLLPRHKRPNYRDFNGMRKFYYALRDSRGGKRKYASFYGPDHLGTAVTGTDYSAMRTKRKALETARTFSEISALLEISVCKATDIYANMRSDIWPRQWLANILAMTPSERLKLVSDFDTRTDVIILRAIRRHD